MEKPEQEPRPNLWSVRLAPQLLAQQMELRRNVSATSAHTSVFCGIFKCLHSPTGNSACFVGERVLCCLNGHALCPPAPDQRVWTWAGAPTGEELVVQTRQGGHSRHLPPSNKQHRMANPQGIWGEHIQKLSLTDVISVPLKIFAQFYNSMIFHQKQD